MPFASTAASRISPNEFEILLASKREVSEEVGSAVAAILDEVRSRGDQAVIELYRRNSTSWT